MSARIVDKNGKVVASRLFEESEKLDSVAPAPAAAAFSEAFGRIAKDMIAWTVQASREGSLPQGYSSVFRYASRSWIWSGSSWNCGMLGCPVTMPSASASAMVSIG